MNHLKNIIFLMIFVALFACGDREDGKVSKGHRDAIKYECQDTSDIKACGLELRRRFLEEGNEFIDIADLNKSEIKKIKLECMKSKSFGLEPYNDCLETLKIAALDGTLWDKFTVPNPKDHIDKLEMLTVRIDIVEKGEGGKVIFIGGGSGVMIDNKKKLIATNCHVALISLEKPNRAIVIKKINKESFAVAKIYKKAEEHDICIVKKIKDSEFKFEINAVKKFKKFDKLKKGEFVRTFGTPVGLEGHTAQGHIQYLGLAEQSGSTQYGDTVIAGDTKIIEHSATIQPGSSGGPLFDKDGNLVGLNTFGDDSFNFSISSDHIRELLK